MSLKVSIVELYLLPKICGIYLVCNSHDEVIYVGQAKNIHQRWKNGHHKLSKIVGECGKDAYIKCIEVPEWLLNRTENSICSFYQPKFNKRSTPVV